MSQIAETLVTLQAEYDRLAKACAAFDTDTKAMLKQVDETRKLLTKDRAIARQKLLMDKLAAFKLLDAAKKQAATEAEGEAVAAEVLGLKSNPTSLADDKSPAMQAAGELDKLSDEQIKDLLEKNHEVLEQMEGFAPPNSREEAIGQLVKGGIKPEPAKTDEQGGEGGQQPPAGGDDKPVTAGAYASVSSKIVDDLLAANAEKVKAVPGYVEPDKRATKIAALVAAGIRPPAKG